MAKGTPGREGTLTRKEGSRRMRAGVGVYTTQFRSKRVQIHQKRAVDFNYGPCVREPGRPGRGWRGCVFRSSRGYTRREGSQGKNTGSASSLPFHSSFRIAVASGEAQSNGGTYGGHACHLMLRVPF